MSGHSKWANIHVKKSIEDKKRAKIFTQLTKNIMIVYAIKQSRMENGVIGFSMI